MSFIVHTSPSPLILVIGGGAAGMLAAWSAAAHGRNVMLLEKNSRLGIKLLVSGGGRCNVTHAGTIEDMRTCFDTNEARFLRHAFHRFNNIELRQLLADKGVPTYERPNGKVFPVREKAGDIVHAFRRMMEDTGVNIRCSTPVRSILSDTQGISGVVTDAGIVDTRCVILATGGSSYAKTGTTGDGYVWARELGHTIVPLSPALAPIVTHPAPPSDLQGVAVRDACLIAFAENNTLVRVHGDILFTHIGISGPAVLEASRRIFLASLQHSIVHLAIDFFPDISVDTLDALLLDRTRMHGAQAIDTWIEQQLPHRLVPHFCTSLKLNGTVKCHQLKRDERRTIVRALKQWSFGSVKEIDIDRGEVTSGGVSLSEVDPKTMRSRIIHGLLLCGEVLDIAGPVGGYNLQAAFSTGFVAGLSAAEDTAAL